MQKAYYRMFHGALLIYDISRRESFESIKTRWSQELKRHAVGMLTVLVGTKRDLSERQQREVSFEEGESLARELGLLFFMECSSKTGEHVEEIVMRLSAAILQQNPGNTSTPQTTQNWCSLL
jgi:GTPase SAR1 family protein